MQSYFGLSKHILAPLQDSEISLIRIAQQTLQPAEPLWLLLSEHFTVAQQLDVFVPLVGVFHNPLLVSLVCSLSVINALSSSIKWFAPSYRPYWWIREFAHTQNGTTPLRQYELTCETSAGFPSSHAMSFCTFTYLIFVFTLSCCCHRLKWSKKYLNHFCHLGVALAALGMSLSRVYIAAQFPHQCVVSSLATVALLHFLERHATLLYTLGRRTSILLVLCCGLFPIMVYVSMLINNVDPHWSVRMAFKWCVDPTYLRHEASPIFVFARDFGFLFGVALSTPLDKKYESRTTFSKRLSFFAVVEFLNYFARRNTMKQSGRFCFLAYEFIRNMMHSFTLLSIATKLN